MPVHKPTIKINMPTHTPAIKINMPVHTPTIKIVSQLDQHYGNL